MNQYLRVTNFHMKGFALRLALKQRRKETRKSPFGNRRWKNGNEACLKPVSQSCAVAKSEKFRQATGQSNLAYKRLAATKASKVWFSQSSILSATFCPDCACLSARCAAQSSVLFTFSILLCIAMISHLYEETVRWRGQNYQSISFHQFVNVNGGRVQVNTKRSVAQRFVSNAMYMNALSTSLLLIFCLISQK